jgi:O-antigen/teichoic acid export membrane protein
MISAPAFIGLALVAPLAVPLIFGAQWARSVEIVQLLSVYGVLGASNMIWSSIIGGLGRQEVNLGITSLAAVLSIGLLFVTAPWGLLGSSLVFVVRGYLILPLYPVSIKRLTGIGVQAQFAVLMPVALACAAMAVAVEMMLQTVGDGIAPLPLMLLGLAFGGLTYALALCLFARSALRLGASVLADLRPVPRGA